MSHKCLFVFILRISQTETCFVQRFLLPTKLAQVGTISIISWIITAGGVGCLAYAFAKCGMYSRRGAGMGGYAEYSFCKAGNFMANFTFGITVFLADVAIALTAVAYALQVMGMESTQWNVCLGTVIAIWLATLLSCGGPRRTGQVTSVTVLGVVIPVVGISLIGWFWFDPSLYIGAWNVQNLPFFDAVSQSISLTLWSFAGFESACSNSDAVENPEKNVPIAVITATVLAALIYIVSTNVIAGIVPGDQLANSDAPFGVAFSEMFSPTVGKIINFVFVISCFGSLMACQFTASTILKSGADEKYFPGIFGRETSSGLPLLDMVIVGIVQTVFVVMSASPSFFDEFQEAVNLSVMVNLIPFIFSMSSIIVLQKAAIGKTKMGTNICAFIGLIYSFYAIYSCGNDAVMGGSIVTFIGLAVYGMVSERFDLQAAVQFNKESDEKKISGIADEKMS